MKTLLICCLFALGLSSCGVLEPVEDTSVYHLLEAAVPDRTVTGSSPSIAIASPTLPGYLDRRQFVSRGGGGELLMNPTHLWAESLDAGIARVTALNLARLSNSLNVQPVKNFVTMDYQTLLEIRIERFEPDADGVLVFDCTWKLQPVEGPVASTRSFRTSLALEADAEADPLRPTGPQTARLRAMNEALARLAREIAKAL